MNKFFALAAVSALMAAAPAVAQYSNQGNLNAGANANFSNRIAQLNTRLQAGVQQGTIDRREAQSLRPQLRELTRLERQYSLNGVSRQERQDLQQRIRSVRQQLRIADGGGYGRNDQYGYNDDDYYDDDDDYGYGQGGYGQGGPYEEVDEVCAARSGISAVLGSILGSDNCLRVGERVTGNLAAVPSQYRDDFRDGSGYYHRYLDGRVVQIDSRTRTVARIYDVND